MNSYFDQVELELREAVRRGAHIPWRRRLRPRLSRPTVVVFACLAVTGSALAATGVILRGSPVRPEELLNPAVGEGIPAPGAFRLLGLRVPDPAGGLPWGMRIVHTTRGELCIQIGRVEHGQLGELGIDGNFHDDDRFHPIPPDALPADVLGGSLTDGSLVNENTFCQDRGGVLEFVHPDVPSSGAARAAVYTGNRRELRDIAFGILGHDAVSVSYREARTEQTEAVAAPIGAYLIIQPANSAASGSTAYATSYGGVGGSTHQVAPLFADAPLTAITYRVGGRLCRSRGSASRLALCRQPLAVIHPRQKDLHLPLRFKLLIRRRAVVGATLSFTAPYAVTSASEDYSYAILVPAQCGGGETGAVLARNVRRGSHVIWHMPDPFEYRCAGRPMTFDLLYGDRPGVGSRAPGSALVGSVSIRQPPDG